MTGPVDRLNHKGIYFGEKEQSKFSACFLYLHKLEKSQKWEKRKNAIGASLPACKTKLQKSWSCKCVSCTVEQHHRWHQAVGAMTSSLINPETVTAVSFSPTLTSAWQNGERGRGKEAWWTVTNRTPARLLEAGSVKRGWWVEAVAQTPSFFMVCFPHSFMFLLVAQNPSIMVQKINPNAPPRQALLRWTSEFINYINLPLFFNYNLLIWFSLEFYSNIIAVPWKISLNLDSCLEFPNNHGFCLYFCFWYCFCFGVCLGFFWEAGALHLSHKAVEMKTNTP